MEIISQRSRVSMGERMMQDLPEPNRSSSPADRRIAAIFTGRLRPGFEPRLGKVTSQCAVACTFPVQRLALRSSACGQLSSRSRGLLRKDGRFLPRSGSGDERSSRPLLV
jgi:hypothetical protein